MTSLFKLRLAWLNESYKQCSYFVSPPPSSSFSSPSFALLAFFFIRLLLSCQEPYFAWYAVLPYLLTWLGVRLQFTEPNRKNWIDIWYILCIMEGFPIRKKYTNSEKFLYNHSHAYHISLKRCAGKMDQLCQAYNFLQSKVFNTLLFTGICRTHKTYISQVTSNAENLLLQARNNLSNVHGGKAYCKCHVVSNVN